MSAPNITFCDKVLHCTTKYYVLRQNIAFRDKLFVLYDSLKEASACNRAKKSIFWQKSRFLGDKTSKNDEKRSKNIENSKIKEVMCPMDIDIDQNNIETNRNNIDIAQNNIGKGSERD